MPAVQSLRPGFLAAKAHIILPGSQSSNPDLDVAQLQEIQTVTEDAFSARFDYKANDVWSTYLRVFSDRGSNLEPQGVTGRFFKTTAKPNNAVLNIQGLRGSNINEFKVGYNAAKSTEDGIANPGFGDLIINLTGSVANTGIAGQGASTGTAIAGGLVRVNSAGNGRAAPQPCSLVRSPTR